MKKPWIKYLGKLFNVLITVLSIFYTLIALVLIYDAVTPNIAVGLLVTGPKEWLGYLEIVLFLFLLGSTISYFYLNNFRMKITASVGFISMILVLLITRGGV